jgi:hypothetical protein
MRRLLLAAAMCLALAACGDAGTGPEPGGPAPVEDSPAGEGSIYD